jgi:signal transduction histidine kinase
MDNPKMRVLMIEDNPGDVGLIREMLGGLKSQTFRFESTDRLSTGLGRVAKNGIDAVLLDLGLPDSRGLDTFLEAQAHALQIPIIVLTGTDDEALALRAVQMGAQDYLVKGQVDSDSLRRCVRYAVERQRLLVQLECAVAELAVKNEELDAFAHTISHDLKEPLRTVEAFSQFLFEDYSQRLDKRGRDYLTRLAKAGARMKRLIDDILALSEVSRKPDPPKRVGLGSVIGDIVDELRFATEEKRFSVKVQEGLPDVAGDPLRIKQIFHNLIGNAVKFNESEDPLVTVGARDPEDGMATFYVVDNGIGIDPRYHDRIFGIFQRLHRPEEYDGTGAGLAIVKRAVEGSGGRVWVESQFGSGTTFMFTLPVWTEARDSREQKAA